MSRNTRSMLGIGIASIGILIGLFLMRRTLTRQTIATNEATFAGPSENSGNQKNNLSSSSFFQDTSFRDITISEHEHKKDE